MVRWRRDNPDQGGQASSRSSAAGGAGDWRSAALMPARVAGALAGFTSLPTQPQPFARAGQIHAGLLPKRTLGVAEAVPLAVVLDALGELLPATPLGGPRRWARRARARRRGARGVDRKRLAAGNRGRRARAPSRGGLPANYFFTEKATLLPTLDTASLERAEKLFARVNSLTI
jgi:hypothetical protein